MESKPPIEVAEYLAKPENEGCTWVQTQRLDDKGRCCGRKPWVYKRTQELFCGRCSRTYHLTTLEQKPNWRYSRTIGGWIRFRHHVSSHLPPPSPIGPAA